MKLLCTIHMYSLHTIYVWLFIIKKECSKNNQCKLHSSFSWTVIASTQGTIDRYCFWDIRFTKWECHPFAIGIYKTVHIEYMYTLVNSPLWWYYKLLCFTTTLVIRLLDQLLISIGLGMNVKTAPSLSMPSG